MPKGYVYILECSDGSFYTGSTLDIENRITQHQKGKGANHTRKRLPIKLVYLEEHQRIDNAFYREKQIQGWNRTKKEALINKSKDKLPELSLAHRDVASRASASSNKSKTYRSNGKLLLTAEYVVLDGAKALALPTTFGQSLTVEETNSNFISWKSFDELGNTWFETEISLKDLKNTLNADIENDVKQRLIQILKSAKTLNPEFLNSFTGYTIKTHADFNKSWGLGTSSTLVNNIARWANINPYKLLKFTFGGSGYDIACASEETAITYQIERNNPITSAVDFDPSFKNQLYFVYLNQKQNSRKGIAQYKAYKGDLSKTIDDINAITDAFISCKTLKEFQSLMRQHEILISNIINLEPVKSRLFNNFDGEIKSLGAWGGDFVLVASNTDPKPYFKAKGYNTILTYEAMVSLSS